MTKWIVLNRKNVDFIWFSIGSIGLVVMLIINAFLLQRLVQIDFKNRNDDAVTLNEKISLNSNENILKKSI